ncbi:MAG: hypothetical protein NPINA01_08700 [Nitrospinaceae bacterium]|nr:MAG: hypothetical protein NPINA01_08700 [Nitrospinaceae bacterium]
MPKRWPYILTVGLFLVFSAAEGVHAHNGHEEPAVEAQETAPAEDSIYAVGEGDTEIPTREAELFSRSDSLSVDIPLTPDPMESMDHGAGGHMDHQMPEVEIAKREWISPGKKKGYGMAVGVTVFAGLIFGVLHFKRPNE